MAYPSLDVGSNTLPNTHPFTLFSKMKTYGFAIAIIIGISGVAMSGVGLAGYFHVGALSSLGQVHAITMMAAGGGSGVILLVIGIIGSIKKRNPPPASTTEPFQPLYTGEPVTAEAPSAPAATAPKPTAIPPFIYRPATAAALKQATCEEKTWNFPNYSLYINVSQLPENATPEEQGNLTKEVNRVVDSIKKREPNAIFRAYFISGIEESDVQGKIAVWLPGDVHQSSYSKYKAIEEIGGNTNFYESAFSNAFDADNLLHLPEWKFKKIKFEKGFTPKDAEEKIDNYVEPDPNVDQLLDCEGNTVTYSQTSGSHVQQNTVLIQL